MTSHRHSFSPIILVLALGLAACAGQPVSPPATPTLAPAVAPTPGAVPAELRTIEEQAEDILDVVPHGNWVKVEADLDAIEQAWSAYQPGAANAGAPPALQDSFAQALAHLQAASTDQDALGTRQAANDVSAAVMDLFALYHPVIPVEIGRLDVLERQLALDVEKQDYTAATATLAKINLLWEQVKPSVLAQDGQAVAEQFEASLATQAEALQAQAATTLTDEVNNGLELVDDLEKVY